MPTTAVLVLILTALDHTAGLTRSYDLEVPGSAPIRIIETEPYAPEDPTHQSDPHWYKHLQHRIPKPTQLAFKVGKTSKPQIATPQPTQSGFKVGRTSKPQPTEVPRGFNSVSYSEDVEHRTLKPQKLDRIDEDNSGEDNAERLKEFLDKYAEKLRLDKKIEDEKRFNDKRYDDKRLDNKRFEDKKFDDKRFDDRRFDDKRFDDKRFDDKRFDDKRFDDKRFDDKRFDDERFDGKRRRPQGFEDNFKKRPQNYEVDFEEKRRRPQDVEKPQGFGEKRKRPQGSDEKRRRPQGSDEKRRRPQDFEDNFEEMRRRPLDVDRRKQPQSFEDEINFEDKSEERLDEMGFDEAFRRKYHDDEVHFEDKNFEPDDDKQGWVSMEAIPWSVSKISKWKHQQNNQQAATPHNQEQTYHRPQEPLYEPPKAIYQQKVHLHPSTLHLPCTKPEIITDGLPANFPDYQDHQTRREGNHDYPISHPFNEEGEWVLLSTTKGYKQKPRQRSIHYKSKGSKLQSKTSSEPQKDLEAESSLNHKKSIKLTVLPPLRNGRINMTTSHGGLLEVESTFQSVDEAHKASISKKIRTKNPPKNAYYQVKNVGAKAKPQSGSLPIPYQVVQGERPDATSVLSAVAAGMIPASMALLVPMAMSGRRKRDLRFAPQLNSKRSNFDEVKKQIEAFISHEKMYRGSEPQMRLKVDGPQTSLMVDSLQKGFNVDRQGGLRGKDEPHLGLGTSFRGLKGKPRLGFRN